MLEEPPEELLFSTELRTGLTHTLSPRICFSYISKSFTHTLSFPVGPPRKRTHWLGKRRRQQRCVCGTHGAEVQDGTLSSCVANQGAKQQDAHSCARRAVWKTFLNQYNKQA